MAHPTRFRRRRHGAPPQMGVVDEFIFAWHPRNRLGTALGFVLGGVVPATTFIEAHYEMARARPWDTPVISLLVLGGLVFSAKTVFMWSKHAFGDSWKAGTLCIILEGTMIASNVPTLPFVLLAILVAINGVATGCVLSLKRADATPLPCVHSAAVLSPAPFAQRPASARTPPPHATAADRIHDDGTRAGAVTRDRLKRAASVSSPQKHFAFELSGSQPSPAGASRNG